MSYKTLKLKHKPKLQKISSNLNEKALASSYISVLKNGGKNERG